MSILKRVPFHPLLISLFPVLALLAHNIDQIKPSVSLRSLVVTSILAVFTLLVLRIFIRDWQKAALGASWLLVFFFAYGQVYNFLKYHKIGGLMLGRHRLLVPLFMVLLGFGFWYGLKKIREYSTITGVFNIVGIVLIVVPLVQLIAFELHGGGNSSPSPEGVTLQKNSHPPDIYYIVLDSYARDDILKGYFNYDNTPFLKTLEDLGFYVAHCSQSNYSQTDFSLASALSINYLDDLGGLSNWEKNRSGMWVFLKQSVARKSLAKNGYIFVAFDTGFLDSSIGDADVYFNIANKSARWFNKIPPINGFEMILIKTSASKLLLDASSYVPSFMRLDEEGPKILHRDQVLFSLDKLGSVPTTLKSPKFVFAHIVAPHVPIVFGPNGEEVGYLDIWDKESYRRGYTGEIEYLNKRLLSIVKNIIAQSKNPPIIIIQGDHGYENAPAENRMLILNAYYLPGGGDELLYPSITPVNSFRVIFNYYFGTHLPLLNDTSYFSLYASSFNFTIVPNQKADCGN